jgi:hypothetical protein
MDHRDIAALKGAWYKQLDGRAMTAVVEVLCSEKDVGEDAYGLSAEDFDADPDFAEDYLGGKYDIACNECGGARVVAVPAHDDPEAPRVFERMAIIAQAAREDAHAARMGY